MYCLLIISLHRLQVKQNKTKERKWSTFALIHTLLRNRLGYDKLHKLVYVHNNLKLRIQQQELTCRKVKLIHYPL
jgi:hypothetical protein